MKEPLDFEAERRALLAERDAPEYTVEDAVLQAIAETGPPEWDAEALAARVRARLALDEEFRRACLEMFRGALEETRPGVEPEMVGIVMLRLKADGEWAYNVRTRGPGTLSTATMLGMLELLKAEILRGPSEDKG